MHWKCYYKFVLLLFIIKHSFIYMQIKVAKINKNDQNYHKLKEVLDQHFNVFLTIIISYLL